jgi:NADH:ubiquinone oxidoreductase subunit 4 (subunit M)
MAPTSRLVDRSLLWTARLSGLGFSCLFLFLLFLFATNEDPPAPAAYPLLVAMSVAVLGAAPAWRWRRFGAIMLLLCAAILGVIAAHNALLFDMGWGGMLLVTPLYAGPPFLAGLLYGLSYRVSSALHSPATAA